MNKKTKITKVEEIEVVKTEIEEMQILKSRLVELVMLENPTPAEQTELSIIQKQVSDLQKVKNLENLKAENQAKIKSARNLFVYDLAHMLENLKGAETSESITSLCGELSVINKNVRAMLPTARKTRKGKGNWAGYDAERTRKAIVKAENHIASGGNIAELAADVQERYNKSLA